MLCGVAQQQQLILRSWWFCLATTTYTSPLGGFASLATEYLLINFTELNFKQ